jgi:hypothetical protein
MEMEEINYLYLYLMLIFRSELTEVRMQQLQMIRGSPSYADRLADNISQKLRLVQKVSIHTAMYGTYIGMFIAALQVF